MGLLSRVDRNFRGRIRADPSPKGRGWCEAPGEGHPTKLFSCGTPHPPLRATLSLRERDSQNYCCRTTVRALSGVKTFPSPILTDVPRFSYGLKKSGSSHASFSKPSSAKTL